MIKPRIIDFLARNKGTAFSSDELYQELLLELSRSHSVRVGLQSDLNLTETDQLRISITYETFFNVKLRELADRGDIIASEKDGETYFYTA